MIHRPGRGALRRPEHVARASRRAQAMTGALTPPIGTRPGAAALTILLAASAATAQDRVDAAPNAPPVAVGGFRYQHISPKRRNACQVLALAIYSLLAIPTPRSNAIKMSERS